MIQTRTTTAMLGTVASPSTISAAASVSPGSGLTALDLTATNAGSGGVREALVAVRLIAGSSAPTTAVTVRWLESQDGTNFVQDGGDVSITMANSTSYDFVYQPNVSAKAAGVQLVNGATNAITAFVQGNTLIES